MGCCSGAVSVPLPTNILAEDIKEVIKEAECVALMLSLAEAPALARVVRECSTLRNIIIMDGCVGFFACMGLLRVCHSVAGA
jgi:hypothetical protein